MLLIINVDYLEREFLVTSCSVIGLSGPSFEELDWFTDLLGDTEAELLVGDGDLGPFFPFCFGESTVLTSELLGESPILSFSVGLAIFGAAECEFVI